MATVNRCTLFLHSTCYIWTFFEMHCRNVSLYRTQFRKRWCNAGRAACQCVLIIWIKPRGIYLNSLIWSVVIKFSTLLCSSEPAAEPFFCSILASETRLLWLTLIWEGSVIDFTLWCFCGNSEVGQSLFHHILLLRECGRNVWFQEPWSKQTKPTT